MDFNAILGSITSNGEIVGMFFAQLIVAVVLFIIGWLVGSWAGHLVNKAVSALKVDSALGSLGASDVAERAGIRLNTGAFLGALVRWFFIVVFLTVALGVFGITQVNDYLLQIASFIPLVVVASLILVASALIAGLASRSIEASARAAKLPSVKLLSGVAKWAIWIYGIYAAALQLGIELPFINTFFTALMAMIAIAGGIAFGLGGKDHAERFLARLKSDIS